MSRVEEQIRRFEARSPLAVRLAEAVSLAVIADPPLLRKARLELIPEADPGTEADLWLSPLVQTRSPDGIVFAPETAEALRARLASDPDRLKKAWETMQKAHSHLTPALRLEEEIAWLSLAPASDTQASGRIERLLRSALAALVVGERRGLAHWAARALPKLPVGVRLSEAARMLEAGAHLRLRGDARPLGGGEKSPDWLSWVAPADLPCVPVAVRLFEGAVELDARPNAEGQQIQLPQTDPLLVDLSWREPGGEKKAVQVTFRKGEMKRTPVPVQYVCLRTVLGEYYDLRKAGTVPRGLQDWVIDFSEERARHRPFFGREEDQENIQQAIRATNNELHPGAGRLILVTGEMGAGKTALLAHIIDRLKEQDLEPPHHFFRRGRPRLEDVSAAEKSLIAQIARRFPEIALAAGHLSLQSLLEELLDLKLLDHGIQPLILILDAVDEAEPNERVAAEKLFEVLPREVPDHVIILASMRTDRADELRLPGPILQLPLSDPVSSLQRFWSHYDQSLSWPEAVETRNFGIARVVLAAIGRWRPQVIRTDIDRNLLGAIWGTLERRIGSGTLETWLGTLAAACEPLPSLLLYQATGEKAFEQFLSPVVSFRGTGSESVYELREEVLREFISSRIDLKEYHHRLAEIAQAAIFDDSASEQSQQYGLRHAADHWLAAGALEPALRLLTQADALTARCRELGVRTTCRGLRRWLDANDAESFRLEATEGNVLNLSSPPNRSSVSYLLDELTQRASQIEKRAVDLSSILYTESRSRGWIAEAIRNFFQLPPGVPSLRLAESFASKGPRRRPPLRHRGEVLGCAFVDVDGPAVLSWSTDGTLRLWAPTDGELRVILAGHHGPVTACVVLTDGRAISASHTLRLWDLRTGSLLRTLRGHQGHVLGILALEESVVVSWSRDRTIRIWNLESGQEMLALRGHEGAVTACAVTLSKRTLISGSEDATVRFWNVSSGDLLRTDRVHTGPVTGIAIRDEADYLFSTSQDRTIRVHGIEELANENRPAVLDGHQLGLLGCAISPDDSLLATWSHDRTIRLWRLSFHFHGQWTQSAAGPMIQSLATLTGHEGAVLSCAFFPEGDRLVSCSADRTVRVWDVETGEQLSVFEGHEGPVRSVGLFPRSTFFGDWPKVFDQIVCASDDRTLRIRNTRGHGEEVFLDGDSETLLCLPFQDRSRVATFSRHGEVTIHAVGDSSARRVTAPFMQVGGGVVTPSGRLVLWSVWAKNVIEGKAQLTIIDPEEPRGSRLKFFGHTGPILTCAVSPNSRDLLSGSMDGSVRIWGFEDGSEVVAFEGTSPVSALAIDPSGRRALAGLWNGSLLLGSFEDFPTARSLTGHTDRVLACAIAPDGLRAVSASADRTLRYWDLETGSTLAVLTGHTKEVTGCAFTRDGRRIVSRSKDGHLGLWDGGSGLLVAFTEGHTDWVNAFAIAEDEGVVYSCSEDQTVRAWDLATGEPRGVVYGVSAFRSLAAVAGGVYGGDEAGNLWVLEYGEGLRKAVA